MTIGFALCGSFCTYSRIFPIMERLARDYDLVPIFSQSAYGTDSRFGTAADHISKAEAICESPVLHTLAEVEPIGPKKLLDALIIAPATGNTLAKLANGITECLDRKSGWTENPDETDKLLITNERVGEVPGTHIITYTSDVDAIKIEHEAFSRRGFALGAVLAAEWLPGHKGWCSMNDMLNFLND